MRFFFYFFFHSIYTIPISHSTHYLHSQGWSHGEGSARNSGFPDTPNQSSQHQIQTDNAFKTTATPDCVTAPNSQKSIIPASPGGHFLLATRSTNFSQKFDQKLPSGVRCQFLLATCSTNFSQKFDQKLPSGVRCQFLLATCSTNFSQKFDQNWLPPRGGAFLTHLRKSIPSAPPGGQFLLDFL